MKYMLSVIVVLAVVMSAFAVSAQTPASTQTEICKGAQAWYNGLEGDAIQSMVFGIMISDIATRNVKSMLAIDEYANKVGNEITPDCLAVPKKMFIDAYSETTKILTDAINNGNTGMAHKDKINFSVAQELIGEFRGYMIALGVTVKERDPRYPELPIWQ